MSAVPGGSWTRTIMVPCGRLAWVATWPLICCATTAASVWMFNPEAASLSVGTSWYCGYETTRFDLSSAKPDTFESAARTWSLTVCRVAESPALTSTCI